MKKKFYEAANLLHSVLKAETNCFQNGSIIAATHVVAIDDDATSAMYAAKLYHQIHKKHGYYPTVLCVGGKGLMSRHTHQKSEAELLAYTAQKLGVACEHIVILGEGKNSGDNVLAVAFELKGTQAKQAPEIKSYYFVICQTIDEVMRLYNGKGLCGGQMLLHELASILNRCEAYAGTFQQPLEFKISDDVRKAAKLLENNYRLKLPQKNVRSYMQLIKLYLSVLKNKKHMKDDLEFAITAFRKQLDC